jgi:hypothetical protein
MDEDPSLAAVEARMAELSGVVRSWCDDKETT